MHHHTERGDAHAGSLVKDPVCGMSVDPATAAHRAEYDGSNYVFCSARCKAKFDADPVHYAALASVTLSGHHDDAPVGPGQPHHHDGHDHAHDRHSAAQPVTGTVPAGTMWTCPMHPEVRRDAPGSCPICGMALEPLLATGEMGPSPELADMTRRFWIGLALALPVFPLEMGGHLIPALHHLGPVDKVR